MRRGRRSSLDEELRDDLRRELKAWSLRHTQDVDVVVRWTRSLRHSSGTERRHPTRIEGVVGSAHARRERRSSLDEVA
ncbi:hypothetical protein Taro_032059 [Colocasia esculenta]|uniref:Uncharacterized protein n=1 Tax=Colocasia esculenta TaxID=4460 RepID=A0A843VTR6_COLES|nr:hypothetical protein [Colocasia esculenta]